MSKVTTLDVPGFPQDVLDAASAVEDEIMEADITDLDTQYIIAKAIMAERERCALVVERTDFIEQVTALTTKTAIAYWSEKFAKLIRTGAAAPVWPEVKNGGDA